MKVHRTLVRATWLSLLFACTIATPCLAANQQAEMEKVRAVYLSRDYVEVQNRLRILLDPKGAILKDPIVISQGRMYLGAALVLVGKKEEGTRIFEELLTDDPQYDPDPLTFPYQVTDIFIDTRARIREQLRALAEAAAKRAAERKAQDEADKRREAARTKQLEQLAGQESVTVVNTRWKAWLPFGVGQFQNRQVALGAVFLGSEAALLASNLITIPFFVAANDSKTEFSTADTVRAEGYKTRAENIRIANLALAGTFAFVWVVGVVQAQIAFVPEFKEVRPRPLPAFALGAPYILPTQDGVRAGVGGTF